MATHQETQLHLTHVAGDGVAGLHDGLPQGGALDRLLCAARPLPHSVRRTGLLKGHTSAYVYKTL